MNASFDDAPAPQGAEPDPRPQAGPGEARKPTDRPADAAQESPLPADPLAVATPDPAVVPPPPAHATAEARPPLMGFLAIGGAVLIWAGWIVATRDAVRSATPLDLSLIRYVLPAIILAPVWLKKGVIPRGENPWLIAIMALGWGGAFVLLTAKGLSTVPAALFGPMVPATLPLFVGLWDRAVEGVRIRPQRGIGLVCILGSITLAVGPSLAGGDLGILHGAPYLLTAAAGWSAFTIAYRRTTLSGLEATAYVCLWSAPFLLVAAAVEGVTLHELSLGALGWLAFTQALASGILSVVCFAYAVRNLGAARTSAFTSLVPVGAALLAWIFLGEAPGPLGWGAVALACFGVAMVNGVFAGLIRR